MILDNIRYIDTYRTLGPYFPVAIDFLKTQDLNSLTPGKCNIQGDDVYYIVQEQVNESEPQIWEMHQEYVDIQFVIAGSERIGVYPKHRLEISPMFISGTDNAVISGLDGINYNLNSGDYLILFPHDVHKPNCPGIDSAYSKKIIVKVRIK